MRYRADIDGLRALAVVPVVLFHANLPGVPGGFTGVDVFFVISGFLITSILAEDIAEGRYSLASFYERRIRRIFPALFVVLAVSSALGTWLLLPDQFAAYGKSVVATTLFASNMLFWRESGYFAAAASEKPLLHTWSLAVEEQFYVVFPLLLFAIQRWIKGRWVACLVPLTVLSFALSVWAAAARPAAAFYLAPTRAWELLLGSLLALQAVPPVKSRKLNEVLALAGFGLIAWGMITLTEQSRFPGFNALFPCLGSALIIYSDHSDVTFVGRILALRPVVFIGVISYSLYLWHWPVLVFARMWHVYEFTFLETIAVVIASFLLATLSWKFVETPLRKRDSIFTRRLLFSSAAAASAMLVAFGLYGRLTNGWPQRIPSNAVEVAAYAKSSNPRQMECLSTPGKLIVQPCIYGASIAPAYALWGDSHADAMITALGKVAASRGQSVLFLGTGGCPPLLEVEIAEFGCRDENRQMFEKLKRYPSVRTVVLMARYSVYVNGRTRALGPAERSEVSSSLILAPNGASVDLPTRLTLFAAGLQRTVNALATTGNRVALVYPVPEVGYDVPVTIARIAIKKLPPESFTRASSTFWLRQTNVFSVLDRIDGPQPILRIYPHKRICDKQTCFVYAEGKPLYRDDDHLSMAGADYIAPLFAPVFAQPVSGRPPLAAGYSDSLLRK